jgi:hypothetical protein
VARPVCGEAVSGLLLRVVVVEQQVLLEATRIA